MDNDGAFAPLQIKTFPTMYMGHRSNDPFGKNMAKKTKQTNLIALHVHFQKKPMVKIKNSP